MNRYRNECVICGGDALDGFMSYTMPVYMGASEDSDGHLVEEMTYQHCKCCGNVQINVEMDPTLLYCSNHNNGVIGNIWEKHYDSFYRFISADVEGKIVLEISDPSAKIATLGSNYHTWTIIEPNPEFEPSEKIRLIRDFFGDDFVADRKYDTIIHSHYMEHCFDVRSFLRKCGDVLVDGGMMMFSIPNLEWLLLSGRIPNNVLQFEHTYYLNDEIVRYLLSSNGFEVIDVHKHQNHSVFYKCRKNPSVVGKNELPRFGDVICKSFLHNHKSNLEKINNFNDVIGKSGSGAYLFGCHVSSQYYIQNGLCSINGILDNSPWKNGKYLYGTKYITSYPSEIVGQTSPIVICSGSGPYREEICEQLISLNPSIVIL